MLDVKTPDCTGKQDALEQGWFDAHGRRRVPPLSHSAERENRRYFVCEQPTIDYAAIHGRLQRHLGAGLGVSAEAFAARAEGILERLREQPQAAAILAGVKVPFMLPRLGAADIGTELELRYLPAVEQAYAASLPDYSCVNHHKGGLAGRLSVLPGSRHERLLSAMAESDVVGYYFPCLPGFSIPAMVEQLQGLPQDFLLAGGFDTAAAFVGSPDLLLRREGYPPLLWLAALQGEKPDIGYHYEAYGYNLNFNRRPHLGKAAEYWSAGLVVLA